MAVLMLVVNSFYLTKNKTSGVMDHRASRILGNELIRRSMQDAWLNLIYPNISIPIGTSAEVQNGFPTKIGLFEKNPNQTWKAPTVQPSVNGVTANRIQFFQDKGGDLISTQISTDRALQTFLPLDHSDEFDSANLYAVWPLKEETDEPLVFLRFSEPQIDFEFTEIGIEPGDYCTTQEDLIMKSTPGIAIDETAMSNKVLFFRNEENEDQEFVFRYITAFTTESSAPDSPWKVTVSCESPHDQHPLFNFIKRKDGNAPSNGSWRNGGGNDLLQTLPWTHFSTLGGTDDLYQTVAGTGSNHSLKSIQYHYKNNNGPGRGFIGTLVDFEAIGIRTTSSGTKNLVSERYRPGGQNSTAILENNIPANTSILFSRKIFTDTIEVTIVDGDQVQTQ